MSKEAMKLALEALEYIEHNYMSLPAPAEKAITALREALAKQPAQQEPVDTLIAAWQSLEETSGHVLDEGGVEGRMHMSVIRSAWEQMDNFVRAMWDERGRK